ncbi:MAG: metal transporter permease [Paucimonas sp.]|nr:metal transporter permease [Paucimonas sp.]
MLDFLLWPFLAGLVLTGIHAWLGLHVLARGVVFVDLSLAQVAALGITVAILMGHPVQGQASYWYGLFFALGGALLFAWARRHEEALQQEAVIGITYAVSAALGVLALDRAPQGSEHIKQLLIGSILTVTPQEVLQVALLYAAVGAVHWLRRKPLLAASFSHHGTEGKPPPLLWDVVFYASFALVVTSSVRMAGVLLVFSYLIVPAAISGLFVRGLTARLCLGWAIGALVTAVGLVVSWSLDLPTGPAIVAVFGLAFAGVALTLALRRATARQLAQAGATMLAACGALLLAFPQADQPWLDQLEDRVPFIQEAFLDEDQQATRADSLQAISEATTELARLRQLEQDLRWGRAELSVEKQERLRQYLAGRAEIVAGDQLVLRELRKDARQRQRLWLGLPMLALGLAGSGWLAWRRRADRLRPQRSLSH